MEKALPAIPAKRYFTIGEVSELCGVKPYVLRYWEQEFSQLRPMKRRGNRRYYQHHEVLLIRRIRELLYDQGFTISGARNRLIDTAVQARSPAAEGEDHATASSGQDASAGPLPAMPSTLAATAREARDIGAAIDTAVATLSVPLALEPQTLRAELLSIRDLLSA
jgi:DNA-binding transcriptional MerR regulator